MASESSERIVELEIQLSHLGRLYEQLNEVVTDQAGEIGRMARQIVELQNQVKELKAQPSPETDPLQEKPPHY